MMRGTWEGGRHSVHQMGTCASVHMYMLQTNFEVCILQVLVICANAPPPPKLPCAPLYSPSFASCHRRRATRILAKVL
jgi:hypothetical protein